LPFDPEDRDAGLAMGGFYETLSLAAEREGKRAMFTPHFTREGTDLFLGVVQIEPRPAGVSADPLAQHLDTRITNRFPYDGRPLEPDLMAALEDLGCTFRPPGEMADLIREASMLAWGNRRFVSDLKTWMRWGAADDGLNPECLALTRFDVFGLKMALRAGRLPRWISPMYAARDVRLARSAPAVAVLTAKDMSLQSIFDGGRRLIRAWITITAAGAASHPLSIVIDEDGTRPKLTKIVGAMPLAMFRIGYPTRPAPVSGRRPVEQFMREPTTERASGRQS
jgi:hypothetical protein